MNKSFFQTVRGAVCWFVLVVLVMHTLVPVHARSAQPATPKVAKITQIDVGSQHSCVLKSDTSIWCWGNNQDSQLANGSYIYYSLQQTQVRDSRYRPFLYSKAVTAGVFHTCALIRTGTVWCWGHNGSGQLGDRTTTNRNYPVQVIRADGIALSGITHIDAGLDSTCARNSSGYVFCWGNGSAVGAQLVYKSDGFALQAVTISNSHDHACAIAVTRAVWCWGEGEYGRLGNNSGSDQSSAVEVQRSTGGSLGSITHIATAEAHTCARQSNSTLWCWGRNGAGQIGDQTKDDRYQAVEVMSGVSTVNDAKAIFTGYAHSCYITTTNILKCWGNNWAGQVGNGTQITQLEPVVVKQATMATMSGVTSGSGGQDHTCVIATGAVVWCWGLNYYGQVGDGTHRLRLRAVKIK
jgi:alpha-tubulin suppressor-like RCC1 family protein